MDYRVEYQAWLDDEAIDEETKVELRKIADDEKEIEDRFYTHLSFGTAGLRGVIGAGNNRMNRYVVARATQGYANYLLSIDGAKEKGVAIAYDSRRFSEDFALETACVLCGNGIRVFLFDTLHAVPQLSFALQYYDCAGGVVITASHNPKQYNGYKVYGENGAQIPPDVAGAITASIESVSGFSSIRRMDKEQTLTSGLLMMIGEEVDRAYFEYIESLSVNPSIMSKAEQFQVVYTPLNGAGNVPVRHVLNSLGIRNLYVVPQQEYPDPEFATLTGPNPELPDTFDLAIALAEEKGAELILATDPDADRLGVAVKDAKGEFCVLSGNQIGCLLLHYILSQKKAQGTLPPNALVVKSIVSTSMADKIAEKHGVAMEEVLTGFRYIGEKIDKSVKSKTQSFVFGFEESYGYLAGTRVRDKDAICACLLLTEAAAYYASRSMTLLDGLHELYELYEYYGECVRNYMFYGIEGLEQIRQIMTHLRENPPESIAGLKVLALRDYQAGIRKDLRTGQTKHLDMPESEVLYFELEEFWLCVRPSGTEPKLKIYANGCAQSSEAVQGKLEEMMWELERFFPPI